MHNTTQTKVRALPKQLVLAALTALLVALSACGSGGIALEDGPVAQPEVNQPEVAEPETNQPEIEETEVEELAVQADPTAPTRLSLRAAGSNAGETIIPVFRPAVGATWEGSFSMTIGIAVEGQSIDLPVIQMAMQLEVTDVDADGTWTSTGDITEASIANPEDFSRTEVGAFETAFQGMDQLSFVQVTDTYGVVQDVQVEGLENLDPQVAAGMDLGQQLQSMTFTVPTQEVGVGATWTDTNTTAMNGMEFEIVTTYEITDIAGDTFTLAVSYQQNIDDTIMSEGVAVDMVGTIIGSGTTVVDINEPGPLESKLQAQGTIEASAEGETFSMDMSLTVDISGR